jgi:hypothetical protein
MPAEDEDPLGDVPMGEDLEDTGAQLLLRLEAEEKQRRIRDLKKRISEARFDVEGDRVKDDEGPDEARRVRREPAA